MEDLIVGPLSVCTIVWELNEGGRGPKENFDVESSEKTDKLPDRFGGQHITVIARSKSREACLGAVAEFG